MIRMISDCVAEDDDFYKLNNAITKLLFHDAMCCEECGEIALVSANRLSLLISLLFKEPEIQAEES